MHSPDPWDQDDGMDVQGPESPFSHYSRTGILPTVSQQPKRKGESPPPETDPAVKELEAGLQYVRSSLKSAQHEVKLSNTIQQNTGSNKIANVIEEALKVIGTLISKKGKLIVSPAPGSPLCKKLKDAETYLPTRPVMVDASTDTILTPSWWDSDKAIEAKAARRRKTLRKPSNVAGQKTGLTETEEDTAMETDAPDEWKNVTRKPPRPRKAATNEKQQPAPRAHSKLNSVAKKPPAILVKPGEGKSYSDTVRAVRTCGLTAQDLGASVTMRETRDGSLLLELPKGAKSSAAAKSIAEALGSKLGDSVGRVSQLGVQVEVEVLDLDAVSSAAEVLEALRAAIPGEDDPAAVAERQAICDVRIWPVRAGQQVATAKMSRYAASKITKIAVGWTMCRVRPRTLPPERCFRCQAFGHNSRNCKSAADRTGACWRCGESGHQLKDCKADSDRCLACEMAGLGKAIHKPGSGACAARRLAVGSKTSPADD